MTDSSHHIIQGAKIEGMHFCKQPFNEASTTPKSHEVSEYQRGLEEGRRLGYDTGRQEGLEVGFHKGAEFAHNQLKDAISMLNLVAAAFQIKKEELFEQVKPEIIKFNINLMEKLLQQQLTQPAIFAALIEKLLQQVKSNIKDVAINVILAPEDAHMLKANFQTIGLLSEALPRVNLIEEPSMARGNCRLETPLGMLNYDISRLLKDLEIKVLEV